MSSRRALSFFLSLLAILLFVVGCGPKWTIIKQATPNPFTPQGRFLLYPPTYEQLHVGQYTEEQYLATKEPDTQATFKGDKAGMIDEYMKGFADEKEALHQEMTPGQGQFVVRPNITYIEPGYYAAVTAQATEVMADVKVFDGNGTLLDEFTIKTYASADLYHPSSGQRMRNAAEDLGKLTAKYLKKRAGLD
jgi:hypothetical protein